MESPISYIIALSALSFLTICTIIAWFLAMIKIKELKETLEFTEAERQHTLKVEETLEVAANLVESLLFQMVRLPLIKLNQSYRVTYSIHNREKAKVRVRKTEEDIKTRKIEEALIGYGEAEKWISLEKIENLYHDVSSEPDSIKIIQNSSKLFQ